ncbi:MAG: hypothetical protein MZV63_30350 [Marinilabiliales bacterium]|nr:hypothetical protein [Marinilabiliales bacterium]
MFSIGNQVKVPVGIDGLVDVNVEQQIEIPQIQIRANRDMPAVQDYNTGLTNSLTSHSAEKNWRKYMKDEVSGLALRLDKDYAENIRGAFMYSHRHS